MPSFFCPDLTNQTQSLVLKDEEHHHLVHVLRHKQNDTIKINSGNGWIGKGHIASLDKTKAIVDIAEAVFFEKPKPSFGLAFSLLRSKNDEWLVEKTTELGVADLFPILTCNSVRNPSGNTLKRFRVTALSAIKQCDNPWLPTIHPILDLQTFLTLIHKTGYLPLLASEKRPEFWMDKLSKNQDYCCIIGPEGGFDESEFNLMAQHEVASISLSSNVLRAETAAIALAAQFNVLRKK